MHVLAKHLGAALFAGFALAATTAHGQLSVNFGTDNDGDGGFTTFGSDVNWSTTSDALRGERVGGWSNDAASIEVPGIAGQDFQITMTVTMDTIRDSGGGFTSQRFGLVFLGSDPGDMDDDSTFYAATFYPNRGDHGELMVWQGQNDFTFPGVGEGDFDRTEGSTDNGTQYTFNLAGTYQQNGDLDVAFSVTDTLTGLGANDVATTTISGPLAGNVFGVGGRGNGTGNVIDYNSFEVIPEPSTYALLGGLGALGLTLLIRRRRATRA